MRPSETSSRIIGVTGGVGCGKSEALAYMERRYGAIALRADEIARDLMRSDGACFAPIVRLFGAEVQNPDGELDRRRIAEMVFSDRELLRKLEAIVHPAVKQEITDVVSSARKEGGRIVLIEAALLLEDHYDAICDEIWYIRADEEIRRERLRLARGYSEEKITSIMQNQLDEETFRARCDVLIDNSGDLDALRAQIDERMERFA